MENTKWTPFRRQVFVALGMSLNQAQIMLIVAYGAVLLPQLKQADSLIPIDDDSGSWIASIIGITLMVGNVLGAAIMGKYGRKIASLLAASAALIGWLWVTLATSITSILIARCLQGIHTGMAMTLLPTVIGECSSPQNRAAFTASSLMIASTGMLFIHFIGAYFSWQITAMVAAAISFIDLLILIYIPESPSWLADQGRYDECVKNFHWLRGYNEKDELLKLIEACKQTRAVKCSESSQNVTNNTAINLKKFKKVLVCREFYLSLFIAVHLYITSSWNGVIVLAIYIKDYYRLVVGPNINYGLQISLLDMSRVIANAFGIYLTKNVRRRVLLGTTLGTNVLIVLVTAIYAYTKLHRLLPFDDPLIGILLSHVNIMALTIATSSLPVTIASEIFPLQFRSLVGGCTSFVFSISLFISIKSAPYILKTCEIYGLFLIYGFILGYCLIATLLVLPETKDRTLQDIEDELRGKQRERHNYDGSHSTVPLTTLNMNK